MSSLDSFLEKIENKQIVNFSDTIDVITQNYTYQATEFSNGLEKDKLINQAGENEGSCKVFAFANMNQLDEESTLLLFGEHYQNVLNEPEGTSHPNIRNFMKYGWHGISFSQPPLMPKE